ncbi:hypothetical protein NMD15_02000 [Plesiomonas shigelloides]
MFLHENGKLPTTDDDAKTIGAPAAYENGALTLAASDMTFTFNKGTEGIDGKKIVLTKDSNGAAWACATNAESAFVTGCSGTITE